MKIIIALTLALIALTAQAAQHATNDDDDARVWIRTPKAMNWRDAKLYCAHIGAHLPSLHELRVLHFTGTIQEQVQFGGPVWSTELSGRSSHFVVAPLGGSMADMPDSILNYTACVR